MAMKLHRAGAVWVNENADAYVWLDASELFVRVVTGEAYEVIERPREDVVIVE